MNETLMLVLAGTGGALLGTIFFGGLWWTIRQGVSSPRPAVWFLGSLLLRMGIVLMGFYLIGHGDWKRLTSALGGFVIARVGVIYFTRTPAQTPASQPLEGSHAS